MLVIGRSYFDGSIQAGMKLTEETTESSDEETRETETTGEATTELGTTELGTGTTEAGTKSIA